MLWFKIKLLLLVEAIMEKIDKSKKISEKMVCLKMKFQARFQRKVDSCLRRITMKIIP